MNIAPTNDQADRCGHYSRQPITGLWRKWIAQPGASVIATLTGRLQVQVLPILEGMLSPVKNMW